MSLYSIYGEIANRPLTTYEQFYSMYKQAYLSKIYTISDLVEKLEKLESVEEQWKHHRDYGSYNCSVHALRKIIDDIINDNLFKGDENNGTTIK